MSIREDLVNQMNHAAKSHDKGKLEALRFILAAVKNKEIELKKREKGLSDDEIIQIISSLIKQRLDSIEQFKKGGREDLVEKETAELSVLKTFMPPQLAIDEIRSIVKQTADSINAVGLRDMGRLMKEVMPKVVGRADGKMVSDAVKDVLSSIKH